MFDWPPYSTEYQRYGAFAKYGVPPHIPIYPNNILSPEFGHDIYGKELEFPSSEPKALKTQKIEKKKLHHLIFNMVLINGVLIQKIQMTTTTTMLINKLILLNYFIQTLDYLKLKI